MNGKVYFSDELVEGEKPNFNMLSLSEAESIIKIDCGHEHCAILTSGGSLYTFGKNRDGQLCHGDVQDVGQPKKVHLPGIFFENV